MRRSLLGMLVGLVAGCAGGGGGSGSTCPPFTQIVAGDFGQTGARLWWTLEVAEDPGLALVTERGQSTWTTFYRFGSGQGDQCEDRLN